MQVRQVASPSGSKSIEPLRGQAVRSLSEKNWYCGRNSILRCSRKTRATPCGSQQPVSVEPLDHKGERRQGQPVVQPRDPTSVAAGRGREAGEMKPISEDQCQEEGEAQYTGQQHGAYHTTPGAVAERLVGGAIRRETEPGSPDRGVRPMFSKLLTPSDNFAR